MLTVENVDVDSGIATGHILRGAGILVIRAFLLPVVLAAVPVVDTHLRLQQVREIFLLDLVDQDWELASRLPRAPSPPLRKQ